VTFPRTDEAAWRAQVEKELKGAPFEKALVHKTADGFTVQPLYTEVPAGVVRPQRAERGVRLCIRATDEATAAEVRAEHAGGADLVWFDEFSRAQAVARSLGGDTKVPVLLDVTSADLATKVPSGVFVAFNPYGERLDELAKALSSFADAVSAGMTSSQGSLVIQSLNEHAAGAAADDELAGAWSMAVEVLAGLVERGLSLTEAAARISFRVAVGRETFEETCKLRALRVGWAKILGAVGLAEAPAVRVHAVASSRTLTQRDPWVNMLRTTTQVFAAITGGADWVTPVPFDLALTDQGDLGRRVARNTGLVLREESFLGRVEDPVAGSYFFETLTVELARSAWKKFQVIQSEGGYAKSFLSGKRAEQLRPAYQAHYARIATRKTPLLGVTEFANLKEELPSAPANVITSKARARRDSSYVEGVRDQLEACSPRPEVLLVTLGTFAESRGRVGFARNLFSAGGVACSESAEVTPAKVACLCGTDESYAVSAVEVAKALKAGGCKRLYLAGKPGELEADLRSAGVDAFIFVGSDVVAVLTDLLAVCGVTQ
jgi:methylmalonyl-CoA mutase